MATRRLFVLLTAGALASAACGGSAAQRAALKVQSQNVAGTNAAASSGGGYSAGDAGASAAPTETGAATSDVAGSPAGAGASASGSAASPAGGSSSAAKSSSAAAQPAARSAAGSSGGSGAQSSGAGAGKVVPGGSAPTPGAPTPGGPPGAGSAVGGATDVGVTANSIKVGHIGIYSGPVGSFGDDLSYAGRAKLQEINDSGGVNGRKLDVLVRDDAWDGTKGMNAARDLVEREHIFAFCCIMSVNTSDPLTPYADEHKIPHIGADGWGEPQYKGAWTFPVSASAVTEAHMLAKYQAEHQQAKRVAIIYINNPTGRAYVKAYEEVIKKFNGEVVFSQPATFDDPGTTTFIAQARTQNIDTISTYLDPGIFTRLVREAAAQNYKPKNAFSGAAGLYFQVTPNFTGPNGEGTIAATHWVTNDMDTPGYRAYKAVVEKYYPHIDHSTWTKGGFVGASIFGNALKSLGLEVTRQRLKDTVDTLSNFETGLGPNISFSPGHHRANKTIYLAQIQRSGDKFDFKYIAGPLVDEYAETN
ncbi:MAG: branched-chain amino acid transport system substrate-binding protein [Actinomycetota bacterium]|jgi:branched-chain amino acid transport system substrate-binding protein|nr:branched-chain amino acid transport system substrate-binding protein [Actinomycetota bacterium]MDQ1506123.1 branched-chain amino acid transport system substrate-binding protein [Actinomycetota bacterium]